MNELRLVGEVVLSARAFEWLTAPFSTQVF